MSPRSPIGLFWEIFRLLWLAGRSLIRAAIKFYKRRRVKARLTRRSSNPP